jgi:hypothetical protein
MAPNQATELRCPFLEIPAELRVLIYQYIFTPDNDTEMFVDISETERTTGYSRTDLYPPHIRYVCKQVYNESSPFFFESWKVCIYFAEIAELRGLFADMGSENRHSLRHLSVNYATLGEGGDEREDIDLEIWSAVAEVLKSCLGGNDGMLETLELETADDRNAAVRFGGYPRTDPRLVAIASTMQVVKLAQLFPLLKHLILEESVLLAPEDAKEEECEFEKMPIVNFMRKQCRNY